MQGDRHNDYDAYGSLIPHRSTVGVGLLAIAG
jgi:hypothetical protein